MFSLCRFCSRLSRLRLADRLRPTPSWLTCRSPTCWPPSSARCPSLCRTWAWTCPCPRAGVGSSCCCGCGGERWAAGWPLSSASSIAPPWGGLWTAGPAEGAAGSGSGVGPEPGLLLPRSGRFKEQRRRSAPPAGLEATQCANHPAVLEKYPT